MSDSSFDTLRTEVVRDQFELFLRYTGMAQDQRERLLDAVVRGEVESVGAYIAQDGQKVVETEMRVDQKRPGSENGGAPEVDLVQYARRIGRISKELSLPIRHWIQVTDAVHSDPTRHRALCEDLGLEFRSTVAPWPADERDGEANGA